MFRGEFKKSEEKKIKYRLKFFNKKIFFITLCGKLRFPPSVVLKKRLSLGTIVMKNNFHDMGRREV